jgi:hypothetical protein
MQNGPASIVILYFAFSVLHFALSSSDAVAVGSGLNDVAPATR